MEKSIGIESTGMVAEDGEAAAEGEGFLGELWKGIVGEQKRGKSIPVEKYFGKVCLCVSVPACMSVSACVSVMTVTLALMSLFSYQVCVDALECCQW